MVGEGADVGTGEAVMSVVGVGVGVGVGVLVSAAGEVCVAVGEVVGVRELLHKTLAAATTPAALAIAEVATLPLKAGVTVPELSKISLSPPTENLLGHIDCANTKSPVICGAAIDVPLRVE